MADYGEQLTALVGEQIRDLRKARGWSMERVAEDAGLHRTMIGLIERGKTGVTLASAARLARALDADLSSLVANAERQLRES